MNLPWPQPPSQWNHLHFICQFKAVCTLAWRNSYIRHPNKLHPSNIRNQLITIARCKQQHQPKPNF